VRLPGAGWPLWSAPLDASVLWVTTSRELSPGPHAARARPSKRRLAVMLSRRWLQFIRIVRRNRDPAFAQQPCQQAHRHPDDVVIGPADRSDQAPALALYSVGTGLILRFTGAHIGRDLASRKFAQSSMRSGNAQHPPSVAPIDHMNCGVDLVRLAGQCAQEGRGLRTIP